MKEHFLLYVLLPLTIICAGSISLEYCSSNQVRMTYQTAYQKNMECRISTNKYGATSVDRVCGKIPVFEDYQK